MGGIIALTVRWAPGDEYRGSCWTNILPEGLWDTPFYIDLDTSKRHTKTWVQSVVENRRLKPGLEEMWGGHNMLAPLGYGLVVVDYVTSTLIAANGYSHPDHMMRWKHDADKIAKWDALSAAGLLVQPGPWGVREDPPNAYIKSPFQTNTNCDTNEINGAMMRWADDNFGLSDAEKAAWATWFKERDE